ncbi:MAG: carbon-nitrogen hydrolase family protein [Deltaproteobacteria bacterium]|nr:carbon-nitrogen hydrolase family protein [Deltaproteobacteria bacterium]
MKYNVAAVQIETASSKEETVEKALKQIELASQVDVKLVCFHEYFNTECPESENGAEELREMAETVPGPTITALADKAKERDMYIVGGSILEVENDKFYNTSVLIDNNGQIVGKYRKTHPENATAKYEMDGGINPGENFPIFDTDLGKIGIMIDVDGSVPGVVEVLAMKGVEVICWPINWSTRWANTIEYLPSAWGMVGRCHVIAANRVGRRSKESHLSHLSYHGSSRVTDPEGNVLAKASNFFEGMAFTQIDTDFTKLWRSEIIPRDYPMRRRIETYEFVAQSLKA